jgi:hypothetical protein
MARNETTVGFEVYELPVVKTAVVVNSLTHYKTSAKEFAELHKVDYATAQGFIKLLVAKGVAYEVSKRKVVGARGKPTNVYELPIKVELKLVA